MWIHLYAITYSEFVKHGDCQRRLKVGMMRLSRSTMRSRAMPSDDVKAHSRERFSQFAQGYVTSDTHSQGFDLDRLLEFAAPQADWLACDIATGGGHTALKIAPYVRRMIATDYAPTMLN